MKKIFYLQAMKIDILANLIEFLPILGFLAPILMKLNLIENKALDTMRRIDKDLTPLSVFEKNALNNRTQIALLKLRVNDIEGYLEKQGFHPPDIDENSFL